MSGESQTRKSWGVGSGSVAAKCRVQGLCCPFPGLLLSQPCLGHWLATTAGTKGDNKGQDRLCFSSTPSREQVTNSSPGAFAPKGPGITELFRLEKIFQISESSCEETEPRPPLTSLTAQSGSPDTDS